MEDKNYIYQLITLKHTNELDKQQNGELQSWFDLSPENKLEYNEVAKLLTYYDRLNLMKIINVDRDLLLVKKRLNRRLKSNAWFLNFQKVAAILIIPLIIYSVWTISGFPGVPQKSATMKSSETAFGVRSQIRLGDGTLVWLNSGTKLIYPDEFNGQSREVKLIGEAYFQVESDSEHPFYVDLNGYKIKATGTRFNISNYPDDKEISAYLEHGKVTLLSSSNDKPETSVIQLKEKEFIVLNKAQNQYWMQNVDGKKQLAWIDGALIFKNDNTADVAIRLGRWFNADIIFDDKLLKSGYVFTATFKQESLEEALRLLEYSSPITYKIISANQLNDSSFSKRKVIISKK